MNKDKALKMAIEAMKWLRMRSPIIYEESEAEKACKEALAQPAQEPVAWRSEGGVLTEAKLQAQSWVSHGGKAIPLYTHPAPSCQECENIKHDLEGYMDANKELINREWQGLSNDMVRAIGEKCQEENRGILNWIDFYNAIESMLKDKNYE